MTESASKLLGFATPEAAVGQQVWYGKDPLAIIGVVRDFTRSPCKNRWHR